MLFIMTPIQISTDPDHTPDQTEQTTACDPIRDIQVLR